MSLGSHGVLALSASVGVALGLALVPSAATGDARAAAVKVTKGQVAILDVDVAGYVEMRQFKDTTSSCSPGVTYTQTNRYTFETGKYVRVRLTNVALPGTDGLVMSVWSRPAGSANITGEITGFRTTNYCPPSAPELPEPVPPTCVKTRGKTSVMLLPVVPLKVSEDDPVPLGGKRMMLSVTRLGGAHDDPSCFGGFGGNISGTDTDNAIVGTSFLPGISLGLPTGLGSIKLFNLKRSDRLRRSIVVTGPCEEPRVSTGSGSGGAPAPGELNANGDCWLTAKIVLSVRRSR